MNKTVAAFVALLVVGIAAAGVFAIGFRGPGQHGFGGNSSVTQAIAAGDYAAFTKALAENNVSKNVSQAQFDQLVQRYKQGAARKTAVENARQAIQNNNFTAWQSAMSTIETNQSRLTQENFNMLVQLSQDRRKVQQAIASNDFATWKQAMTDMTQLQLTQDHFNTLVQHYKDAQNRTQEDHQPGFMMRGKHSGRRGAMREGFGVPPDAAPAVQ